MFAKLVALSTLVSVVAAGGYYGQPGTYAPGNPNPVPQPNPTPKPNPGGNNGGNGAINNSCNVEKQQCCNQVQSVNHQTVQGLMTQGGLIGAALAGAPADALVGINCSPLSVVGIGGNSCNAQPVCCSNNSFNGLIAIGCTPINVNL